MKKNKCITTLFTLIEKRKNKKMKKPFAYIILVVVVVLCGVHIYRMNWNDLSWDANNSSYTGLIVALLIGALVIARLIKGEPKI